MKIILECRRCGGNRFHFPPEGNDASAVTCQECGRRLGTMGEVKEQVARTVLEQSRKGA